MKLLPIARLAASLAAAVLPSMGVVALAVLPVGGAAQDAPRVLVDPNWVAANAGPDLVILQVGPPETYAREHIPGARAVTPRELAAPMGDGTHDQHLILELPDPAVLEEALERLGIGDDSRVVVVPADGWLSPATRVLFTLDWAGLGDRAYFLDGGLEGWKAAGHPVTAERPTVTAGSLTVAPRADRVVSMDFVRAGHGSAPGTVLLDARARTFYAGERADRGLSGHIPGAASVPWSELVTEEGDVMRFKSADQIRAVLAGAGVEPGDTVVAYCHIGQFATAVITAARIAGFKSKLYDGSFNQWALEGLPVETGGGRERP